MYAIIRAGGKQAKVQEGDLLDIERVKGVEEITFTPLLVVDNSKVVSDRSELSKAKVLAAVVGEHRGDKIEVFKYKPKTGYRRSRGHRQHYTTIEIKKIELEAVEQKKTNLEKTDADTNEVGEED